MPQAPRRILFGPIPPPYGGVSTFMAKISPPAAERGVEIWSYSGTPKNAPHGTLFLNHRRLSHILALMGRGRQAQIVDSTHFHLEYPHRLLLPLWLAAKAILVFRWTKILHDGSLPARYASFTPGERRLFERALRNIDEIVVYSRELEDWLPAVGFKRKISFISILLPAADGETNPTAKPLGLEPAAAHAKRVSSIGVFLPSYGFEQLAIAIERIRLSQNLDVGLMLVDGGFAIDEEYRGRVLRGRDWITVIERIDYAEIGRVFAASDCFVRPVEHESLGLSRVEAIWSGIPVIATDVGETRGMLTYQFGDISALVQHLRNVLEGSIKVDTSAYADMFRREAQDNLERFLCVICREQ